MLGEVIAHPDYSYDEKTGNRLNDIALIKLREPLDIENNPDLGLICVPDQNDDYNPYQGQMATVVGWGLTSNQLYTSSKVLLKVSLPVNSMDECVEMYDLPEESKNSMICTYQVGASPCMVRSAGGGENDDKIFNICHVMFLLLFLVRRRRPVDVAG